MKHFKIVGPETTREFDIEDDEMLYWDIHNIQDTLDCYEPEVKEEQNVKIYDTEKEKEYFTF